MYNPAFVCASVCSLGLHLKPAYSLTLNISLTPGPERNSSMPKNQSDERRMIAALCWQLSLSDTQSVR
jgi:hypothetical protein